MRVLFVAPLSFGLRSGGMQLQVQSTRRALEDLGVEVVLCDVWRDALQDADVCHVFSTSPEVLSYAQASRHRGVPVVVSPIFNVQGSARMLELKTRIARRVPGCFSFVRQAERLLRSADIVLPLSVEEQWLHERVFGVPAARAQVIENGVDPRFARANAELFVKRFGFHPDVLFVGRIDRNKNVLRLIQALEGTGLRLAVVGFASDSEPETFAAFQAKVGDNVTFVGRLEHEDPLLASAYAASRVFCLPSLKEVMPLSVLEAVLAGCSVVLTRNTAMGSILGDGVRYIDPLDVHGIRSAVRSSLAAPSTAIELRRRVLDTLTWPSVAGRLKDVYDELQAHRSQTAGTHDPVAFESERMQATVVRGY